MLEPDKKIAVVNPYLVVNSVDEAADYYFQAYGARQAERYEDKDGKVWYCVLKIYGAPLQLMEPDDAMGLVAKDPSEETDSIAVNIDVSNVDKGFNRALKAGAEPIIEPEDAEWGGRTAEVRDPFGHRWVLGPRLAKKDRRRSPVAPNVIVEDVDTTVSFWQNVLGAREARRIRGSVRPEVPTTVIRIGGAAIQITAPDARRRLAAPPRAAEKRADAAMVTVIADDVDALFEKAVERGAKPIVEPQDAFWGDRYAEFRDISGLRVASCGEQTLAEAVVYPADLQRKLNDFLEIHGEPSTPAAAIGAKNVGMN